MTILLFGKDGQLGRELRRALAILGEVTAWGRQDVDLEDPDALRAAIANLRPRIIVNAAAYTAVDKAESDRDKAAAINTHAVKIMAEEARRLDAWLVHYSTDYVFDGNANGAYLETDAPAPLNIYGQTKLAGEQAVQNECGKYLIFRTSWVFAARGKNFATTMLKLFAEREALTVVSDQHGAPTSAELIADVSALALHQIIAAGDKAQTLTGIYHLTASGVTNWHDYAVYLCQKARARNLPVRVAAECIAPVSSAEYRVAAARPKNSVLNTEKIKSTFGIFLPPWQYHVDRLVEEMGIS